MYPMGDGKALRVVLRNVLHSLMFHIPGSL